MLLNSQHGKKNTQHERLLLGIGLLLLLSMILFLLWKPVNSIPIPPPDALVCDAEENNGESFTSQSQEFGGLAYKTEERARSGKYSILLPADGQLHFGFSTEISGIQAGEVYEISIWSFGNESGEAQFVVKGTDPEGIYLETDEISKKTEDGWALHKVKVSLPFNNAPSKLNVFVYSNGGGKVFFDDLQIQRVQVWDPADFQVKKLFLNIDPINWQKLNHKRELALSKGILQNGEDEWVKAKFGEGKEGEQLSAKIRLKGDWLDHLKGDKWSFRVKLSNDASWNGMNVFSLHTPEARYFLHEWLLHRFWQKEDILTTRYDFVELIINGKSRGIYAYEEHFAKQLVESQKRREGPILKFSEDGFWASTARQFEHHRFIKHGSLHSGQRFINAPIIAFQEDDWIADTVLYKQYKQAHQLLEQFKDGEIEAGQIFDISRMAKFYAICDLLNAYHGVIWHNQRFYYNPIIGKIEPIGFDGFADKPAARYHFLGEGSLQPKALESESLLAYFMQHKEFVEQYISALESYSRPTYMAGFWSSIEKEWKARLQWIQLEFPSYNPNPDDIKNEMAFIRSKLLPFSETSLKVSKSNDNHLALQNTHSLPLIIKGYGQDAHTPSILLDSTKWLPAAPLRQLWTKLQKEEHFDHFRDIRYWNEQALQEQSPPYIGRMQAPFNTRFVFYQIPGWDSLFSSPVRSTPIDLTPVSVQSFRSPSSAENFPTLRWEANYNSVVIPKGAHTFSTDLIIGKSQRLIIEQGADIDLQNQSAIISYGAIRAIGEEENMINIRSSDGTGQGLQVLEAEDASVLKMVVFQGLKNLSKGTWQLTGAVTFYESAVKMIECRFLDNQSEDGLNLIRSEFEIDHCLFQNTSSDGFDADFCKGKIMNSSFVNTANDGMDFSGSIITASDCTLVSCGDKGISVGEASDVMIINTTISDSQIGIASKDQSVAHARNLTLVNCEQGLVAFQKKPEFGPANILVEGLKTENVKRLYQKGEGSRLEISQ